MYPMMTRLSFGTPRFIARASPSKVIHWDTLYLVFKDRFPYFSESGFRSLGFVWGCPQVTIYRPKQTVTLTYAALIVKHVEIGCAARVLVHARCILLRPTWPTKQPPSLTKASEREAARQTRSSVLCCQPPCFRQGGIINIPDCLSTARAEIFDPNRRALSAGRTWAASAYLGLLPFGSSLSGSTFNKPLSFMYALNFTSFNCPSLCARTEKVFESPLPSTRRGRKPLRSGLLYAV